MTMDRTTCQLHDFTIIGVYEDSDPQYQRFAEVYEAPSVEAAEAMAPDGLLIAGVIAGSVVLAVPESTARYRVTIDTDGHNDPPTSEEVESALVDGLAAHDFLPLPLVAVSMGDA